MLKISKMEHYKHYIELQGLLNKVSEHEENIKSFQNRVSFIQKERERRSQLKAEYTDARDLIVKSIKSLEKDLFNNEKLLERANINLSQASSASQMSTLESDILRLKALVDQNEESILSKIDEQDTIELLIKESSDFLDGSFQTLNEITNEVELDCSKEQKEISNYQSRINLILNNLDPSKKDFFKEVLNSSKDKQAITFLNGKICTRCRYEASSIQITEIENGRSNEVCNNCSRILIPRTINAF